MGERFHTEEEWREIHSEIDAHLHDCRSTDPKDLTKNELVDRLIRGQRHIEQLDRYLLDLLGELAEDQIRSWVESTLDLPAWFVASEAEVSQ